MPSPSTRPLPAERLVASAARLFDRHGIRAVGVDQLVTDADVARASLYQNFGSKDGLVTSWLEQQDLLDREGYERAVRAMADDAAPRVQVLFDRAAAAARRRRFRGCLYLNAATEFPNPTHPVHAVVAAHRRWLHAVLATTLRQASATDPEEAARRIQVIYDGGLAGSKAARSDDPIRLAGAMAAEVVATALRDTRATVGEPATAD
ncbi:TetR/AcrR family transcriptional regulator [Pseudonocardia sp. CA-142604]|uniref:TetR/AcrR family transcriptional regulator n=1 Tax=Pseudonocardia sp. CA-142604 TaxID=3240024 RepID=UPI003D91433F